MNIVNDKNYLELLIGKQISDVTINTNTVFPINDPQTKELFTMATQIRFQDYFLQINNPVFITPPESVLEDLIGSIVTETKELPEKAVIMFDNNSKIEIDMRDEVYSDPEAMSLSGPNNFWVVWN